MSTTKPTARELLDKLEHHLLHEHPDADQTQPCKFKDDVLDELRSLIESAKPKWLKEWYTAPTGQNYQDRDAVNYNAGVRDYEHNLLAVPFGNDKEQL